ncbi:MAG: DUF2085 domain-containing protein [Terriglobia bacterium]|nr:DUF2085 domain-containing protein [Terriglobia bacterium]
MNFLRALFSFVCGQQHCWTLGGQTLPFCQRCTGLYVGAFCALILILIFRLRPRPFLYWVHGICMLIMFPFGFHFVAHGGLMRTFTGALFGFGLVYYLALNPMTLWDKWKTNSASRVSAYFLLIATLIALLLFAVRTGGRITAIVLAGLGTVGFIDLSLLTVMNFVVLPATLRALRPHSELSSQ